MDTIKAHELNAAIALTGADKHKSKDGHLNSDGDLEFTDRDLFWAKALELVGENPNNDQALYLRRGNQSGMITSYDLIWKAKNKSIGYILMSPGNAPECYLHIKDINKFK